MTESAKPVKLVIFDLDGTVLDTGLSFACDLVIWSFIEDPS